MRKIPSALNVQFKALLVKNKISQKFHSHYLKWLRYYLDFCHKYGFSEPNPQSLPNFIRKLKEKRQTDVQQKQANEAIHIYYELIRSKPSNNISELPKHPPKPEGVYLVKGNWQAAYKQLSNEIKARHYSPKTLKSYSIWVRQLQYFSKSKDTALLSATDIKDFLTFLAVKRKVSVDSA